MGKGWELSGISGGKQYWFLKSCPCFRFLTVEQATDLGEAVLRENATRESSHERYQPLSCVERRGQALSRYGSDVPRILDGVRQVVAAEIRKLLANVRAALAVREHFEDDVYGNTRAAKARPAAAGRRINDDSPWQVHVRIPPLLSFVWSCDQYTTCSDKKHPHIEPPQLTPHQERHNHVHTEQHTDLAPPER